MYGVKFFFFLNQLKVYSAKKFTFHYFSVVQKIPAVIIKRISYQIYTPKMRGKKMKMLENVRKQNMKLYANLLMIFLVKLRYLQQSLLSD